jgi:hypothetical protein
VSGQRLRLTTSRPAGYRRGGQVIGNAAAPTFVGRDDITAGQLLAVMLDPNIALAFEAEDGRFETLTAEERELKIDGLKQVIALDGPDRTFGPGAPVDPAGDQTNTAEPQGEGLPPAAEASQAGGPDATAAGSTASAGDAATTEPTAQPVPPAPEPAATPKPASKGRGKAKGSPA